MKRLILTIVALAVLQGSAAHGSLAGETGANTQSPNERIVGEIKSLEYSRLAAGLRKDVDAVSATTAEDYLQIDTDGRVLNKPATLERIKSSYAQLVANPVDDVEVRVHGDTAILTGRARPEGVLDGKAFKDAVRYTRIYVKRDGRWQVVLFQQTRVAEGSVASAPATLTQERESVMGDLLRDVATLETKIVGLAEAMPAAAYEYRPAAGVRSTGQVLLHVAGDNYFVPALMGVPAPADTGIDGKDNKTVAPFEARRLTRDQTIVELKKSFDFFKRAMSDSSDAALDTAPRNSMRKTTVRATWIAAVTHLHEHLGQLIAYARSNGITPPWSK
jgi:ketosteroid isomerase-like protein